IRLSGGKLRLPKAGEVRMRLHREIPEGRKLKSVTVSMEPSGKYYASLLCEYEACENQAGMRKAEKVLGNDYAMDGMAVFSTGEKCGNPGYYRQAVARHAREQRRLSKCQKGSRNYRKQKRRVALCHEKVKNQRKEFRHKLSR